MAALITETTPCGVVPNLAEHTGEVGRVATTKTNPILDEWLKDKEQQRHWGLNSKRSRSDCAKHFGTAQRTDRPAAVISLTI